ncbi:MAG TPA: hypothetical protein VGT03_05545 [Candidatus Acidoferrales bacterium]|nr:hypothetical protein [Candidatus Acidoferrales bacterium]
MDSTLTKFDRPPQPDAASDRLDSWKEIGAYLKRDIRTAQRWERAEQLPIHRPADSKRGSVYAFRAEIDDWWRHRYPLWQKGNLQANTPIRERPVRAGLSKHLRYFVYVALTLVVLLVLGAGRMLLSSHMNKAKTHAYVNFTIAVLPFKNLSPNPGDRSLAQGLTHDVITSLAKLAEFHVIPVDVAASPELDELSPVQIARNFHSDAVVESTIMRSGDRIRITIQLIDARSGERTSTNEIVQNPQAVPSLGNDIARLISDSARTSLVPRASAP